MPELPEVETVRRGLVPHMEGAVLEDVITRRQTLRYPLADDFVTVLKGRKIEALDRRAKYLLIHLEGGWVLMVHLGMSGRFLVNEPPKTVTSGQAGHNAGWNIYEKHDHVIFHLNNGARVIYNDPRRFGFMHLLTLQELDDNRHLKDLGPEPLDNMLDAGYLAERFKSRKSPIKNSLLDQKNIAGLGNIYVCESLWRANIHPERPAMSLTAEELQDLVAHIKDVIAQAIEAGGSSLKDFRQTDGELGYFQHMFDVYDREGEACRKGGCDGVIARITQSGRSSFYCPHHQV